MVYGLVDVVSSRSSSQELQSPNAINQRLMIPLHETNTLMSIWSNKILLHLIDITPAFHFFRRIIRSIIRYCDLEWPVLPDPTLKSSEILSGRRIPHPHSITQAGGAINQTICVHRSSLSIWKRSNDISKHCVPRIKRKERLTIWGSRASIPKLCTNFTRITDFFYHLLRGFGTSLLQGMQSLEDSPMTLQMLLPDFVLN